MSSMNLLVNLLAYEDDASGNCTSDPNMRSADFKFQHYNLQVSEPQTAKYVIPAGQSVTVFDGTRLTNNSATTQYDLTLTGVSSYRLTAVAGPLPSFRVLRNIAVTATTQISVTINNNSIISLTGAGFDTTAVQVGDVVHIDTDSDFSVYNRGDFSVLAKGTNYVQVQNPDAVAESVTIGANFATDFKIFSSSGVQVGDALDISAGFSTVTQGTYEVAGVTDDTIDFVSTNPLPLESAVTPGLTGLVFYTNVKNYILMTANKNCYIRFNSDASNNNQLQPVTSSIKGMFIKIGRQYKCIVVNASPTDSCDLLVFTAE